MSTAAPGQDVHYLVGAEAGRPLSEVIGRLAAAPAWPPFDDRAVAFVGALSRRLLKDRRIKQYPELAVLGHWFRPAALRDLAARHGAAPESVMVGRGLAFHIAPANVDSVSMYSWLLSLLAGNANVVRISSRAGAQLAVLLEILQAALDQDEGRAVAGRLVILTYGHDDAVTQALSMKCHLRVVWGGDESVARLRAIALRPTALELCFPDRFSLAVLRARRVAECARVELRELARRFCNDAFWFAQQACSSPRMVVWIGEQATGPARERFWSAVAEELAARQQDDSPAMAMDRTVATYAYAAAELARPAVGGAGQPTRLAMERPLEARARTLHCGQGLFLERDLHSLEQLGGELTDKEQTLSVFGFTRAELEALVLTLPARSVDRIVPVGDALAFSPVWDGHDLVAAFSRRVAVTVR